MSLYLIYFITGLANGYLLLFLAGVAAGVTLIPTFAIVGALLLFATSGVSLFRKNVGAWIGMVLLAPIFLWQILAVWEERKTWGALFHPIFSVPFLLTLAAIVMSIRALVQHRVVPQTQTGSMPLTLQVILFAIPVALTAAYIFWLAGL